MAKTIGTDLGTTNSLVAILEPGQPSALERALERAEARRTSVEAAAGGGGGGAPGADAGDTAEGEFRELDR
jgi:molecular chaperone DnaK (HSP70)